MTRPLDLSIPLQFDGPQPAFFGADGAQALTLQAGSFVGDVRRGGSVNCARYSLTPHCNGTHTECIGHITRERVSVRDAANHHLVPAILLSVAPQAVSDTSERSHPVPRPGDRLITRAALQYAARDCQPFAGGGLVVRTLPNDTTKLARNYDTVEVPPYFSAEAMGWIVDHDIRHLVVDLPSVDRSADEGLLTAHRLYWGVPPGSTSAAGATRPDATITELAYADSSVADGRYLLNLQVAPFDADAAPSRPVLYPLVAA